MKKFYCILIFAFCGVFCNAALAAPTPDEVCAKIVRKPKVELSVSYGKLKYDFSKSGRSLTRMHIKHYGGGVPAGKYVNGLATNDLTTELTFKLTKNTLNNGMTCVYPSVVELKVKIDNPTIYLAKEMEKNSCMYNIAMRHEQTHQQINVEAFDYYLPMIKSALLRAVQNFPLMSGKADVSLVLAKKRFTDEYMNEVNPVLNELQNEIKTEQAKLDSQAHYDYEAALCGN